MTDLICDFCGRSHGRFELATCIGAPKGGVPVHLHCLADWFRRIDENPFWQPSHPQRMMEMTP
jgi:hypothetical protein